MPRRSSPSRLLLSTAPLWLGIVWMASTAITCATGSQNVAAAGSGGQSASSAGGGPSSSSSAASGNGGSSTTASSSGSGGAGGGSSSSAASSSSGTTTAASSSSSSASSSSSSSSGAAQTILSVVAEGNDVAASTDDLTTMTGFSNPYDETTSSPIGAAFTGSGLGVVVIRSQPTSELRFATWNGAWIPGFGATMLPVQGSPTLVINGGPSLAGGSTNASCAYQGTDMKFYYAEEFVGSWFPTNEAITAGTAQSTGPVPPAITTLADVPVIAFIGTDGDLYDQARTGGTWQASHPHGVAGHGASVTPAIVALTQGPELLIVYTDSAADGLMYTLRTSGTWSTPAAIAGASSADQVSLAPLTAGGAVLSYQGTDGLLYTTLLSASAPYTWSAPVAGVMGASPMLESPPAVATGAAGAEAELLYLDTTFTLYSARMTGGAWGAAALSGAAQYRLAVATGH